MRLTGHQPDVILSLARVYQQDVFRCLNEIRWRMCTQPKRSVDGAQYFPSPGALRSA